MIRSDGTFVKTKGYCTDVFFAEALAWIDRKRKEAGRFSAPSRRTPRTFRSPAHPAPTHSANFGVQPEERLDEVGVPCELVYPAAESVRHATVADFLIGVLLSVPSRAE